MKGKGEITEQEELNVIGIGGQDSGENTGKTNTKCLQNALWKPTTVEAS